MASAVAVCEFGPDSVSVTFYPPSGRPVTVEGCSLSDALTSLAVAVASLDESPGQSVSTEDAQRFWLKVRRGEDGACWPWAAGTSHGYGRFGFNGRVIYAHRMAYLLHYGVLPAAGDQTDPNRKVIRHLCNNTVCCNPSHLALGTQVQNINDRRRAPRVSARLVRRG